MNIKNLTLAGLALCLCACGEKGKTEVVEQTEQLAATDAPDMVRDILEGKAELNLDSFSWVNEPKVHSIHGDTLELVTEPATDLWLHTMNATDLVNAPVYVLNTREKDFTFSVKTEFSDAKSTYDQCGPVIYVDENNWLKASVEHWSDENGLLGSVNNQDGRSDWAPSPIPASVRTVWYRVMRSGCDYMIMSSQDGEKYEILRFCHLNHADEEVRVGVYACSPNKEGSFKAVFTDMEFSKMERPSEE